MTGLRTVYAEIVYRSEPEMPAAFQFLSVYFNVFSEVLKTDSKTRGRLIIKLIRLIRKHKGKAVPVLN
jgi:hypothetical protein